MSRPVLRVRPLVLLALAACAPASRTGQPPVAPSAESTESTESTAPKPLAVVDSLRVYSLGQVTTPPTFTNVRDIVRQMQRNHPPLLRDAGRGGTVVLMVQMGRDGQVQGIRVLRSSGEGSVDTVATRTAARLRGRPARIGDTRVAVEVEVPFEFGVGP